MKNLLLPGFALLAATLCSPVLGQGTKNKPIAGSDAEYAKLGQLSEIMGRLAYVDSSTKKLALDIDYVYAVPNRNYNPRASGVPNVGAVQGNANAAANLQRQWSSLAQQQRQALTIRNPAQRAQRLVQIAGQAQQLQVQMMLNQARALSNLGRAQMQALQAAGAGQANLPFKPAVGTKQFELKGTDDVVVRRWNLPFEYDDKGYPKKYSKEEIETLRGKDPKRPGYTARYEDLQVGQTVKMYLVRGDKKDAAPKKDDAVKKEKDDAADEDAKLPTTRMILILADSDGRDTPTLVNRNKKEKK